jgi:hypothetical protein
MSIDDSVDDARSEYLDPLTAPVWHIDDNDDLALAPPIEKFFPTDEDTMIRRRPLLPPDADQIIRGEYTGWIPLIKAGESLEEAKAREEKLESDMSQNVRNFDVNSWSPIEVGMTDMSEPILRNDLSADSVADVREPIVEIRPYNFPTEIVPDPDFVISPAEALEEARRRIAQMRASLQTNVNRVSQSFEHPIFAPIEISVNDAPPYIPEARSEVRSPISPEPNPIPATPATDKSFESMFETEVESVIEPIVASEPQTAFARSATYDQGSQRLENAKAQVREESRVFTQSTQQSSPTIIIDEAADQAHSLELVIMRDEIKDLRDRLDSSQKLIENLMVRLADLAELALKRRD